MPPPPNPLPLNNQAALQDAQAGAAAITDPNNPLGSTLHPQLQALSDITYNNVSTGAAANAAVGEAQAQVAAQKAAEAAKSDPTKYQRVQTQDGGYKFYGPDGKEVSASEYARVNNTNPATVLKDSQNPIDIAFQQDYQQLQQYFQDKLNSKTDENAAKEAAKIEQTVKDNYKINLAGLNPAQVIQKFKESYPTVFGLHTTGAQGTNALLPSQDLLNNAPDSAPPGQ